MDIKFDPNNVVIKLCMSGMRLEDSGDIEDTITMFHKAWLAATGEFENDPNVTDKKFPGNLTRSYRSQ